MKKVALVTNALGYLGPGSVAGLLREGMIVVGQDPAFTAADACAEFVGDREDLFTTAETGPEALIEAVLARHGRIDALICNDIVPEPLRPIDGSTADDYRQVLEQGAIIPFRLSQAVLGHMRQRRSGAIIFVTSATALHPMAEAAIYGGSRAATTAYGISLGQALGPDNIQVNVIGPNWTSNPTYFPEGWQQMMPGMVGKLENEVPLRRLGTQEEVGEMIALLASQRAMPLTAQFLYFAAGAYP